MVTFPQCLEATDGEDRPTFRKFCQGFNINNANDITAVTQKIISSYCTNAAWRKLWTECVTDFPGYQVKKHGRMQQMTVELGKLFCLGITVKNPSILENVGGPH
jgi:hypothetical protein